MSENHSPSIRIVAIIGAGWFSACSCRGGALASSRGSVSALLRSQAFALVSPRAISAYRARPTSESGRVGAQYERAAARPGTPLRLAGVFADGSKAKAPKYAQLIDPQGNILPILITLLKSNNEIF
ncbi:unnamed protein product [Danaus chrysippus]|uniref:(African queen) hypothetical protein n=1 Tax=Danaus chrysippus TaxID=151541 RepID=A0A8J2QUN7_9NEOP|nr:unnamed protein product [Danaus chrysippus]